MGRRIGRMYTTWQEVDIEVDIDEVLAQLSPEEIQELYEDEFGKGAREPTTWEAILYKRRFLPEAEFLKYIDRVIEDQTGRII